MAEQPLVPWEPPGSVVVPASAKTPAEIVAQAKQLSKRDTRQIVSAFRAGHYEMVSAYVWSKAMAALRKQLATLGMEFIGEMLRRPDITADSHIGSTVTAFETISLAEDLGVVTTTQALRLRHAHETINHFASLEDHEDVEESMTPEEAVLCLRACVQSILGHPDLQVAQGFAQFRRLLEERTFSEDEDEMVSLSTSPYFYRKTTLSVLLALLKTAGGAQLEHAVRNSNVILPILWRGLRKPERWQIGQTYAELYAEGKKPAVAGLKKALLKVSGFDFVPENLRSNTFTAAARDVLQAHEGMNNFYNEPAPMRALASLGTSIPGPAFPVCMTATLSVFLGNRYSHSWAAQGSAKQVLKALSEDRWTYYLEECLPSDRRILFKLTCANPCGRWAQLVKEFDLRPTLVKDRTVKALLSAGHSKDESRTSKTAERLTNKLLSS